MNPLKWSWGPQQGLWIILWESLFWKHGMSAQSVSRPFPPPVIRVQCAQSSMCSWGQGTQDRNTVLGGLGPDVFPLLKWYPFLSSWNLQWGKTGNEQNELSKLYSVSEGGKSNKTKGAEVGNSFDILNGVITEAYLRPWFSLNHLMRQILFPFLSCENGGSARLRDLFGVPWHPESELLHWHVILTGP